MLIDRKKVIIPATQKRILNSAWGEGSTENSVLEKITYLSDGLRVKGYLAYPLDTSQKYPCIIWCRGGYGNAGALDDFHARGILGQIASWGYTVFQTQYRGNAGGEGKDSFGGDDLNDVLNLELLARDLEFANTEIWGIEGWSRGGMMTYLALTKRETFNAAISTGGISNLQCTLDESNFMKKLFNLNHSRLDSEFCSERTILKQMEYYSKKTPTLLLHGTHDNRIPPHHSLDLSYKFLEYGIEHKLVLFEKGDHFLREHKKEVDLIRKNWFAKYLKQ